MLGGGGKPIQFPQTNVQKQMKNHEMKKIETMGQGPPQS